MSDVVYGRHSVMELLKARPDEVEKIYFQFNTDHPRLKEILITAKRQQISVGKVRNERLIELSGTPKHQGVCALVAQVRFYELDEILQQPRNTRPMFVILDALEDPQNIGAIIRTAEAVAADAVILPKDQGAPINATVNKTSAGALSHMRMCRVTNITRTIEILKEKGVRVFGTDMEGVKNYIDIDFTGPCAIVIGSEGKGMRQLVKKNCDELVRIPIAGCVESLNASVSAAVVLYEAFRQRLTAGS